MQRVFISSPVRCQPRSYLCTLLFLTILTVVISTTIVLVSYPCSLPNTKSDHLFFPHSFQQQLSLLQTQLGLLLEQLHIDTSSNSNCTSKYADQFLHIALSLDNIVNQLSNFDDSNEHANPLCSAAQVDSFANETDGGDEADDDDLWRERLFRSAEAESYIAPKPNRHGIKNFLGIDSVHQSVALTCAAMQTDVDRYMDYKIYQPCPDDWLTAQKLMLAGCDPLPRRRCFGKSPQHYSRPLPVTSSLWKLPSDKNVLWSQYKCKSFSCLVSPNATASDKGFFKCSDCFNISKRGWEIVSDESRSAEFTIEQILSLKPGEIRIGLDYSPSTGTFAALMNERNVTIASATLNLGAPFSEVIASRGLLPLYVSVGSRLPFFDNTLDIIHSTMFFDGWIEIELLNYVLFDWDRILRPKGIIWVDRFFCSKDDMLMYQHEFEMLRYKKLMWRVVPKTDRLGDELFLSAVLEKPLRS